MKFIQAIIRPNKLEEVRDALTALNISSMTVIEVRGHGRQKGHKAAYRGTDYSFLLLPKTTIDVVVSDEMLDEAVNTIIKVGCTKEIGDGRVFVFPVEQAYHIRTGERDAV